MQCSFNPPYQTFFDGTAWRYRVTIGDIVRNEGPRGYRTHGEAQAAARRALKRLVPHV